MFICWPDEAAITWVRRKKGKLRRKKKLSEREKVSPASILC